MASTKPHLLTLPREIRDLVYTYLSNDVEFEWGYRTFSFPLGGSHATTARVHGVPSLSALLTCTRIFEEYSAAPSFKNVSLSMTAGEDILRVLREDEATHQERALELFSHIQHVDFLIDTLSLRISLRNWVWMNGLTTIVSKMAPGMATVRVTAQRSRLIGSLVWKPRSGEISGSPPSAEERTLGYTAVVLGGKRSRDHHQGFWNRALDTTATWVTENLNDTVGRLYLVELDLIRQEWLFDRGVKAI